MVKNKKVQISWCSRPRSEDNSKRRKLLVKARLIMWKKVINGNNADLKVSRASFIIIQIEVKLRVNVDKVIQLYLFQ
jgi:hypothetical protein